MKLHFSHIARRAAGFTMVEIAICLAIIGLALVSIIGVLPIGMHVQRDNREETVIDQDASVLLESIRNGVRGGADLTNYVYAITNYWTLYSGKPATPTKSGVNWYTYNESSINGTVGTSFLLTSNANIIGVLSTPEFQMLDLTPTYNMVQGGYSNHLEVCVHSLSGLAMEKPPQDNQILLDNTFSYLVVVANSPVAMDTNLVNLAYNQQLAGNLHELRLGFYWPIEPNGTIGLGRQTQRTMIAGMILMTNEATIGQPLYYYQSQTFTNSP